MQFLAVNQILHFVSIPGALTVMTRFDVCVLYRIFFIKPEDFKQM